MPLLVPLAIALVITLTASLMWVWARYLAHRAYATPVAIAVAVLAAVGIALLVASDGSPQVPAAAGWAVLAASAVALVGGWVALATVAPAAAGHRRR